MMYRGFELDRFQNEAIQHLKDGRSVLVSAPTGTGKTIIADWIVDQAFQQGKRVVYTAPIKALSNQKYRDYCRLHGEENVGLVTGDLVIRRDAPCVVMTTEILRNMLLSQHPMDDLLAVVVDEAHFLDDPDRGTVWEEVLIYLPPHVRVVALSATFPNLADFAKWLQTVRGHGVEIVTETVRAVPLEIEFGSKATGILPWSKMKTKAKRPERRDSRQRGGRGRGRDRRGRTSHLDVFRMFQERDYFPYLYFVFSRADAERFAKSLTRNLDRELVTPEEGRKILKLLNAEREELGSALDNMFERMLLSGVAFHHAGLHVSLKALVERLYEQRLIKVLYCTSTFALGINMPARAVAFNGLMKYDGRGLAPLRTRAFMQKAGRAGRRGLDDVGYVVVKLDPEEINEFKPNIEGYLRERYEPVRSSFQLSFNSIVNLLSRLPEDRIREIVDKSFMAWSLARAAERQLHEAHELDILAMAGGPQGKKAAKQARRLRRRAEQAEGRCWNEFEAGMNFLKEIGYLEADGGFLAGARVLQHIQIEEIAITEFILEGFVEELDDASLFGALVGLSHELPRRVEAYTRPTRKDRELAKRLGLMVRHRNIVGAGDLSGQTTTFDPNMMMLAKMWVNGKPLDALLSALHSNTDYAGTLVTALRRGKDLMAQVRNVYRDDQTTYDRLSSIMKTVTRDEVEVVG